VLNRDFPPSDYKLLKQQSVANENPSAESTTSRAVAKTEVNHSMSGMPFLLAFLLATSIVALIAVTQWRRLHPFIAIVFVASAFGLAAGLSISLLGKAFGAGFSRAIYAPGLVIVAAAFVAALAENAGATGELTAMVDRWRSRVGSTRLAALLGLIASVGASPSTAFALLTPLIPAIGGAAAEKRGTASLALALAISASHGLVLFSPVVIAAASILDAAWGCVALFGLPVAVLSAAFGAAWARWLPIAGAVAESPTKKPTNEIDPIAQSRSAGSAIVLLLATAIPLLMLMVQSLGDIPSEPLGGGTARELVLGVGRPLILFLVGLGIVAIGTWRTSAKLLADSDWTARVLGGVAGILLTVGAAGGFQRLCQETGMAELLGERLLAWHLGPPFALLIPFLVAAAIKTLQGSSLVAAITTAGMVQPILFPLGLSNASGNALAALAVGAGAMTSSHVNDELFWLVANSAGLTPLHGLARFTIGTLLQGLVAVAGLLLLHVLAASL
jgi:gluconate:H+ symporter, GntP family